MKLPWKTTTMLLLFGLALFILSSFSHAYGEPVFTYFNTASDWYVTFDLTTYRYECTNFSVSGTGTYQSNITSFYFKGNTATGLVRSHIYSNVAGGPGASMGASDYINETTIGANAWKNFTLTTNPTLNYSQVYWACLQGQEATGTKIIWAGPAAGAVTGSYIKSSGDGVTWGNYGANTRGSIIIYNTTTAGPPASSSNYTFTAKNDYSGASILNFSVFFEGIGNYTSNATTGTLTSNITANATLHNVTFYARDYAQRTYLNINGSNSTLIGLLNYNYYSLNLSTNDTTDSVPVSDFNLTINGTTYANQNGYIVVPFLSKNTSYPITVSSFGYTTVATTINVTNPQQNYTAQMAWSLYRLNVSAYSYLTGSGVATFTAYGYYLGSLYTSSSTTTNSTVLIVPPNSSIIVEVDAPGYALQNKTVAVTSGRTYINFTLNETNSINFTILKESDSSLITTNISIYMSSSTASYTYSNVSSGKFYTSGIDAGDYTILFSGTGYSNRYYYLSVANRTSHYLTAYLSANTSTTTFVVKDSAVSTLIDNALITMYRFLNSSWVPIESKLSDITGTAQFNYEDSVNYQFVLSKSGYQDLIFNLNPILYSSYDVYMDPSGTKSAEQDFDTVNIIMEPTLFFNDENNNFTFNIQSPTGNLLFYGYYISFVSGNTTNSGVNAIGERLYSNFTITGATSSDFVQVDYYYSTPIAGTRTFTVFYPISSTVGNYTLANLKKTNYGMSVFERLLIMTFILLFVVGIATFSGRSTAGVILGLFIMGFLVSVGFIPIWSVLLTMLVGVILLTSTGGR